MTDTRHGTSYPSQSSGGSHKGEHGVKAVQRLAVACRDKTALDKKDQQTAFAVLLDSQFKMCRSGSTHEESKYEHIKCALAKHTSSSFCGGETDSVFSPSHGQSPPASTCAELYKGSRH